MLELEETTADPLSLVLQFYPVSAPFDCQIQTLSHLLKQLKRLLPFPTSPWACSAWHGAEWWK